ncbi:MAG: hypothetical protein UX31_C0005G0038 [Candidatus Nomurabacteria bacterium GW2011_GWA1_46_11]|uniref:DinB-like domain-containing protein n=2 Tax=Parcubacteria group TaxID=1794811 RepID=A0A1G1YXV3_9BACT|nr:MAG: hypothetical protein UX29_C0002G0017 [Parcubacteria group bacterium GW2011_GWA2_46_10]KKU22228.1 MAG: hypothetical protein UX31_C0005G0038 [Candidatus Nomurabacteria bacterium GW2011_GWA1_46_11]OGY56480.1 MAG: hypothetical protein A2119_00085 [Candidatus Colwellbacteria bacterium GWA2_46_10]
MKTDILQEAIESFDAAVLRFPQDKRRIKLFGEWNLQDIIAHVSGWNIARIEEINRLIDGKEITFINDYDEFNRQSILTRRSYDWDYIYKEFLQTSHDLINAYPKIPDNLLNKRIWSDKEFTPSKWIGIDTDHIKEHLVEIEKFVDKP